MMGKRDEGRKDGRKRRQEEEEEEEGKKERSLSCLACRWPFSESSQDLSSVYIICPDLFFLRRYNTYVARVHLNDLLLR